MKPLRHETDLVLSNTEWEGKIFRRDNLLFLTRVVEFSLKLNKVFGLSLFFQMWLVVYLNPSDLEYLLLNVVLYCGITKKAKRNVV